MLTFFFSLQELTQRILDLFGCHLQDYIKAKDLVTEQETLLTADRGSNSERLWKAYASVTTPHLAMTSDNVELNYTRAVIDLLLHVLVPSPHLESRTGRFVVGELITCNVLLPLIAKLSDPDWLNLLMIDIFDKSCKAQEPIATEPLTSSPPLPSSPVDPELTASQETSQVPQNNTEVPPSGSETEVVHETKMCEPSAYDVCDAKAANGPQSNTDEEETQPFLKHYLGGSKSNPFYQENDSDLDSPLAEYKQSSTDSLVMIGGGEAPDDRQKDFDMCAENNGVDLELVCPYPADGSCPKVLVNSEPVKHPNVCGPLSVKTADVTPCMSGVQDPEKEATSPTVNPNKDLLLHVEQTGSGNPNELTVVSPLQGSCPMPSFSFEPLSSPDGPVIIQNLRITGTITAKEHRGTGSHPYTLYTIKVRRRRHLSVQLLLIMCYAAVRHCLCRKSSDFKQPAGISRAVGHCV